MRIGIVTDIHDEVRTLELALTALRAEEVDAIVSLGDTSDLFGKWEEAQEVAALLKAAGVLGVWGNHDYGLCRNVKEEVRFRFLRRTLDYFATMQPTLELGGCHFSHIEPFLDPENTEHLWSFNGRPEDDDHITKSFAAVPHRALFIGHFHRWLAVTDRGRTDWTGSAPLHFEPATRYLVVVGPLFRGDFAVIDSDRWILEPRRVPITGTDPQ